MRKENKERREELWRGSLGKKEKEGDYQKPFPRKRKEEKAVMAAFKKEDSISSAAKKESQRPAMEEKKERYRTPRGEEEADC